MKEDYAAIAEALKSMATDAIEAANSADRGFNRAHQMDRAVALSGLAQTAALLAINETLGDVRDQIEQLRNQLRSGITVYDGNQI